MSENRVQVLFYTSYLHVIGGIETFVQQIIELLSPYYDIGILCPRVPGEMLQKISLKVPVFVDYNDHITCDTLVMIRMMDEIPRQQVTYKKSIRMCHACKTDPFWQILPDCDEIIHVSEASKKSFVSTGSVIYNPLKKSDKEALLLVSATRIPAADKGKNAMRMLQLARMLVNRRIPYLWLNFSDQPLQGAPKGFYNVGSYDELQPYIKKADYLVQLSDQEGFGYSVLEALINHTAVICTPFATTKELGVIDGLNGYIVPYDLRFEVDDLLKVPEFDYEYDNDSILEAWRKKLGKTKPEHTYNPGKVVVIKAIRRYEDVKLKKTVYPDQELLVTETRAKELCDVLKYCVKL